jgi:hypothetical protein
MICEVIVVILALDPKWKLAYTREKWDNAYFEDRVKRLEEVVYILLYYLAIEC